MECTFNNAWVESYLEALLTKGLSSEHFGASSGSSAEGASPTSRFQALDEEQSITTRYYVSQIMSLDEDRIRDAWSKAARCSGLSQAEKDARMEHLSWRVWAMKRRRAQVEAALAADRREAAAELLREEDDELDSATRMTIDDLNLSAMAAFEGAFGSVTLDTLEEEDAAQVAPPETQEDQPWQGVKDYGNAPLVELPAGLRKVATSTAPPRPIITKRPSKLTTGDAAATSNDILGLAAAKLAEAGGAAGASPFSSVAPSPFSGTPRAPHGLSATQSGLASPPPGSARAAGASNAFAAPTLSTPASPRMVQGSGAQAPTGLDPLLVSRFPRLYVILISLHGLVRGEKMELGKDPDTGGQVKYVVELAKALAQFPSVARVDLLTRLIADPKVDASYSVPEERLLLPPLPPRAAAVAAAAHMSYGADTGTDALNSPTSCAGSASLGSTQGTSASSASGAFIVRLPCGNPNKYLRKEDLWPHVREFSDRAIAHAHATLARLQESGEGPCELYVVHGHYADAGEVAALVSSTLGVDCVLTGHSLGRNKKEHLLKSGTMSTAEVESTYKISRRIEAEERALDAASVVFTSTQQEVAEQWGAYDGYSDELSAALQLRPCRGYHVPRMAVIPPGLDFSNLKVSMPNDPWEEVLGSSAPLPATDKPSALNFPAPISSRASEVAPAAPALSQRTSEAGQAAAAAVAAVQASGAVPTAADATATMSSPINRASIGGGSGSPAVTTPASSALCSAFTTATTNSPDATTAVSPDVSASLMPSSAAAKPAVEPAKEGAAAPVADVPTTHALPPLVVRKAALPDSQPMDIKHSNSNCHLHGSDPVPPLREPSLSVPTLSGAGLLERVNAPGNGPVQPRNSLPGNGFTMPPHASSMSRRTSQTGGGLVSHQSVSATPRGAATPFAASPMQLNPQMLAAMMVGDSEPHIWKEINRFLKHPGRPVILAMSRPDAKKNILALVKAYGQSRVLRELANLVLVLGNRDVIDGMAPGSARVMSDVLKLIDTYDLYGSVAYPKRHSQADISDIYLLAAATRGVFVNVALQEPFGLTLIEAAAHGAPIVATTNGGPVDIVATLNNGKLVEPTDIGAIAEACISVITSQRTWDEMSENGRKNITYYSWPSHCARYLRTVQDQKYNQFNGSPGRLGALYGPAAQDALASNQKAVCPAGRMRHTLSLSYDDLGSLARAIAANTNSSSAAIIGDAVASAAAAAAADSNSVSRSTTRVSEVAAASDPTDGSAASDVTQPRDTDSFSSADVDSKNPSASKLHKAGSMPSSAAFTSALNIGNTKGKKGGLALPSPALLASVLSRVHKDKDVSKDAKELLAPALEAAAIASKAAPATLDTLEEQDEGEGSLFKSSAVPLSHKPAYLQPRMAQHDHYVVFNLDTLADLKAFVPQIKSLAAGRPAAELAPAGEVSDRDQLMLQVSLPESGSVGVGIMCPWSHKVFKALCAQEGIDPLSLDFMVCSSGALIWHVMSDAPPASPHPTTDTAPGIDGAHSIAVAAGAAPPADRTVDSEEAADEAGERATARGVSVMCDDEWEKHVDFRWDDKVVQQVMQRILASKTGWGKLHLVRPAQAASTTTTTTGTTAPAQQQSPPPGATSVHVRLSPLSTPLHCMIEVDLGPAAAGKAPLPPSDAALQFLSAFRRKLRMSGLRAQLCVTPRDDQVTLASLPRIKSRGLLSAITDTLSNLARGHMSGGGSASAASAPGFILHVTPLRCSRSLAMRHLAARFRKSMATSWTLVARAAPAIGDAAVGRALITTASGCSVEATRVPSGTSPAAAVAAVPVMCASTDSEELVAGVQKTVLVSSSTTSTSRSNASSQLGSSVAFPLDVSVFEPAVVCLGELGSASESQAVSDGFKQSRVVLITE